MKSFWSLIVAATALTTAVSAASNHSSRLRIHIPHSLYDEKGEEHLSAEFGFTSSSGVISTYLYYVENTLCSPLDWNKTTGFPVHKELQHNPPAPFVLLATSGFGCSVVTKARHAQAVGAAALVLADHQCRCADKNCTDKFGPDCIDKENALVNDGSGLDVSIPSFLLFKVKAQELIEVVKKNQTVLMELAWGLPFSEENDPKPDPVYFYLWTTARDPIVDLETFQNIKTVAQAFQPNQAQLQPRYAILDGGLFGCTHQVENNGPCDHLCTNHGRYCALHQKDLSGAAIVTESLRRLCIWEHYGNVTDQQKHAGINPYWDYLLHHVEHCHDPHQFANDDCIAQSMAKGQIDVHKVNECIKSSGDPDQDVDNHYLQDMIVAQAESGMVTLPGLMIHHHVLGNPSSYELFRGICEHYWYAERNDVPDICYTCGSCPNAIGCLKAGKCVDFHKPPAAATGGRKTHRVRNFFIFLLTVAVAYGGWYYYKVRMTGGYDFDRRGGGLLNTYMQLNTDG